MVGRYGLKIMFLMAVQKKELPLRSASRTRIRKEKHKVLLTVYRLSNILLGAFNISSIP
jgi:hypothetical protein